jgi:hypothetical protein
MDHDLLTRRANIDFGIAGTALNWLSSYLHGRETYVAIGQTKSTRSTSSTGVPQGSVLGPFLFSMFVSPVGRIIKQFGVQHHQYADDTQLYTAIKPGTGQLNDISKCADAVTRWFLENGLLLNPSKTEAVIFGSRQQISKFTKNNNLTFSDTTLTTSNTVKILGVTLDSTLSMDNQTASIIKSCNYHIRALRHIRPCLTKDAANTIACGIVNSRLDYCNSLLSGTSQKNLNRLQRVQNSLARVVCRSHFRCKGDPLLQSLHWLPIRERIAYKINLITYKTLSTNLPIYLSEVINIQTSSRSMRSSDCHQLVLSRAKTKSGSKAFSISAPQCWNKLSKHTRITTSIDTFKKRLKTELFRAAFLD